MHLSTAVNEINQGYRKGFAHVFVYNCRAVVNVLAKLQDDGYILDFSKVPEKDLLMVALKIASPLKSIRYCAHKQGGGIFRYNQLVYMRRFLTKNYYFHTTHGILSLQDCLFLKVGGKLILTIS